MKTTSLKTVIFFVSSFCLVVRGDFPGHDQRQSAVLDSITELVDPVGRAETRRLRLINRGDLEQTTAKLRDVFEDKLSRLSDLETVQKLGKDVKDIIPRNNGGSEALRDLRRNLDDLEEALNDLFEKDVREVEEKLEQVFESDSQKFKDLELSDKLQKNLKSIRKDSRRERDENLKRTMEKIEDKLDKLLDTSTLERGGRNRILSSSNKDVSPEDLKLEINDLFNTILNMEREGESKKVPSGRLLGRRNKHLSGIFNRPIRNDEQNRRLRDEKDRDVPQLTILDRVRSNREQHNGPLADRIDSIDRRGKKEERTLAEMLGRNDRDIIFDKKKTKVTDRTLGDRILSRNDDDGIFDRDGVFDRNNDDRILDRILEKDHNDGVFGRNDRDGIFKKDHNDGVFGRNDRDGILKKDHSDGIFDRKLRDRMLSRDVENLARGNNKDQDKEVSRGKRESDREEKERDWKVGSIEHSRRRQQNESDEELNEREERKAARKERSEIDEDSKREQRIRTNLKRDREVRQPKAEDENSNGPNSRKLGANEDAGKVGSKKPSGGPIDFIRRTVGTKDAISERL